jgi:hypothetical protein
MFSMSYLMNHYERETLFFIYGRTRLYNKEWERIPHRHFLYGVRTADGRYVIAPVDISRHKVFESIKHLREKGIIEVRRVDGQTNQYRIRTDDEIDTEFVANYMRRHQSEDYDRIFGKLHNRELTSVVNDTPPVSSATHPPVSFTTLRNIPNTLKDTDIKVRPAGDTTEIQIPVRTRRLIIPARKA